jgi:hypothetical protein
MRRSGVRPWIATAAAAVFVLFGPGAQNILWAFQIGFTGALVLGLTTILLADHDRLDWRDGLGVLAAVLAVMSTGAGIATTVAAGVAVLLRRGWRTALLYVGPPAATYGLWSLIEHPDTASAYGRPPLGEIVEFVWSGVVGTFLAMGHYRPVAVAMAVVLLAGAAVSWAPAVGPLARRLGLADEDWRAVSRRWALPTGLLVGAIAFLVISGIGRSHFDSGLGHPARVSRYMHLTAACTLPALAVAAEALARRWRLLTIPLILMFLVPVPANERAFEPVVFDEEYMFRRSQILSNAVRMPFARQVPRDVRPIPDFFDGNLTIGFLLDAHDDGKFPASDSPVPATLRNELRIRLGLAQRPMPKGEFPVFCAEHRDPLDLAPARGDRFQITSHVDVVAVDSDGGPASPRVRFNPTNGFELTAELADLQLRLLPTPGRDTYTVCGVP